MNLYKHVSDSINNKLGFKANLEVPKNILDMESEDFYLFVMNEAYPIMKDVKSNNPEIIHIIRNLQAYVNQFDDTIIPWSGLTNNFSN